MRIEIDSYTSWKNNSDSRSLLHFSYSHEGSYKLLAIDGIVIYTHNLDIDDVPDYELNYLPKANLRMGNETKLNPFASKFTEDNKSLFKRVHGSNNTIAANSMGKIELVVPYNVCKFSGAEIINCSIKDTVDFKVLDTPTNSISGLDPLIYGANFKLNQFGFNVEMKNGSYSNTSNYDASLYKDMVVSCEYTNNSSSPVYIAVDFELHEVK